MDRHDYVILALVGTLVAGCGPQSPSPLDVVGAVVTAPITAPLMFLSARINDRESFLERARRNDRPLPPIDARSQEEAGAMLGQALAQGVIDQGFYWQNDDDVSGYAAGGATVIANGRTEDGKVCREVLIETVMEGIPSDQRVRTYCRDGDHWSVHLAE